MSGRAQGAAKRFTFDLDFGHAATVIAAAEPDDETRLAEAEAEAAASPEPVPEPAPPAITESDLEAARQAGFAEGEAAGRAAAEAAIDQAATAAMQQVASGLSALLSAADEVAETAVVAATELGLGVTRRLLPEALARHGDEEVLGLFRQSLAGIVREPRIVVRVAEDSLDAVQPGIDQAAKLAGHAGRIILLGDPDLGTGETRIEWADGGIVRDHEHVLADADRLLADTRAAARAEADIATAAAAAAAASSPESNDDTTFDPVSDFPDATE